MAVENPITQARIDRLEGLIQRLYKHDEITAEGFELELQKARDADGGYLRSRWVNILVFLSYLEGDITEILGAYEEIGEDDIRPVEEC